MNIAIRKFSRKIEKPFIFAMIGIVVLGTLGVSITPPEASATNDTPPQGEMCSMVGVHDSGSVNSQFFSLNTETGHYETLGPKYDGADIEAMDAHPTTDVIYAITGNDAPNYLKTFNMSNGSLSEVGKITGASGDYTAASFNPVTGQLWAFLEDEGLYTIDTSSAAASFEAQPEGYKVGDGWEGLAWNLDGTTLYGAGVDKLYEYNPATGNSQNLCGSGFLPDETEALEMRPDGTLVGSYHHSDDELVLFDVDPGNCTVTSYTYTEIPYDDVETLTFGSCTVPTTPELTIEKYVSDSDETLVESNTANPSETLTYTIKISNIGDGDATNVAIVDDYDESLVSGVTTDGVDNGDTIEWLLPTLAAGDTVTKQITADVVASASDVTFYNTVTASSDQTGEIEDEVETYVPEQYVPVCNLVIDKSTNATSATPGGTIDYTIEVENTGDGVCYEVHVLDYFGDFISYDSSTPNFDENENAWIIGDMQPGDTWSAALTANVSNSATDGDIAINEACACWGDDPTKKSEDNWVCDEVHTPIVETEPDPTTLEVTKYVSDSNETLIDENTAIPGEQMTYTVKVQNTGNADAIGVTLVDDFDETKLVNITSTDGNLGAGILTWNLGNLTPGENVIVTFDVQVDGVIEQNTDFLNLATADALNTDPASDSVKTNVEVPTGSDPAVLQIIKVVSDNDETNVEDNTAEALETLTYTVTVTNIGGSIAENVSLVDDYDQTKLALMTDGGGVDDSDTVNFGLGDMAPGASQSVTITGDILDSVVPGDTFDNVAIATADNADNVQDKTTTTIPEPNVTEISITKTVSDIDETDVSANTAQPGEGMTYTIVVENIGANIAENVTLVDNYDESQIENITSITGTDNGDTITWNLGDMNPGAITTIVISADLLASLVDGNTVPNEVTADADNTDPVSDDVVTTVSVPQNTDIDLALTKQVNNATPEVGTDVTFTIFVTNEGINDATGVTVEDILPQGLTYVTDTGGGDYDSSTGIWTIGNLAVGETVGLDIAVTVTTEDEIVNTAQVATADQTDVDSTPGNNVASEDDQDSASVTATTPPQEGLDLELTKTVNGTKIKKNDNPTWTITVTNTGNVDATGVTVKDILPSAFKYVSDTSGGNYGNASGIWNIGDLAVGQSASIDIVATAMEDGTFVNTAQVQTADGTDIDSTPGNDVASEDDQDSASIIVESGGGGGGCSSGCGSSTPSIDIEKTVDVAFANPGQVVTYTFVVTNNGFGEARNVTVVDTLPNGFTFTEFGGSIHTWNFGDMNGKTSTSTSYEVTIDSNQADGNYDNLAVVTIDNGVPPNNTDQDSATVEVRTTTVSGSPRLEIGKVVGVTFTNPDTVIEYTVTVQNVGSETAINVTVDDVLPLGFTFVEGGTERKTFFLGDMVSGATESLTYKVRVGDSVTTGFYENVATADADNTLPVSDDAIVEVREPQVLGLPELPETGASGSTTATYSMSALAMIAVGIYTIRRREEEAQQITVNFIK